MNFLPCRAAAIDRYVPLTSIVGGELVQRIAVPFKYLLPNFNDEGVELLAGDEHHMPGAKRDYRRERRSRQSPAQRPRCALRPGYSFFPVDWGG